jgi:cytochrome P450 family 150 subfamily A5
MTDTEAYVESRDFFKDQQLFIDPHPYYDDIRARCPVMREPFHDVVMVTGFDEALEVYSNPTTWSCATRWPGRASPFHSKAMTSAI